MGAPRGSWNHTVHIPTTTVLFTKVLVSVTSDEVAVVSMVQNDKRDSG